MKEKGRKIKDKVNELKGFVELIAGCYRGSQKSVQMAYLYALLLAVRELQTYVLKMRNQLLEDLHDEFGLDYHQLKQIIHTTTASIEETTDLETLKELQNDKYSWKYDQLVEAERDYDFRNCEGINLTAIVNQLWIGEFHLINNIVNGLKTIEKALGEICFEEKRFNNELESFEERYKDNAGAIDDWSRYPIIESLKNRYEKIVEKYDQDQWMSDLTDFKQEVKDFIDDHNQSRDYYERFMREKNRNASTLASLDPKERCIFVEVFKSRSNYQIADIQDAIYFRKSQNLLEARIEAFDLMQPADESYDLLFVNKAAQEMMMTLAPYIKNYIVFPHSYSYAALLFAMIDFGITPDPTNNGKQMLAYVNGYLRGKNDKIADETTITKKKKLVSGRHFGSIKRGEYAGTLLDNASYDSLKETYWACFSVFNIIFEIEPKDRGFAYYLEEPHDRGYLFNKDLNKDPDLRHRLKILKSVIVGETADF